MTTRRGFLTGIGAVIAAPAIVRASSLMGMPRILVMQPKVLTLMEWAKIGDRLGIMAAAVALGQFNPMFDDIVWQSAPSASLEWRHCA